MRGLQADGMVLPVGGEVTNESSEMRNGYASHRGRHQHSVDRVRAVMRRKWPWDARMAAPAMRSGVCCPCGRYRVWYRRVRLAPAWGGGDSRRGIAVVRGGNGGSVGEEERGDGIAVGRRRSRRSRAAHRGWMRLRGRLSAEAACGAVGRSASHGSNAVRCCRAPSVVEVAAPEVLFHTGEGGCKSRGRASRALARWGVGPATKSRPQRTGVGIAAETQSAKGGDAGAEFGRAGRHLGWGVEGQLGAITCAGAEVASVAFRTLMGRPRNALDEVWEPVKASSRNIARPKKKFPAF
ncbi:hypothetical protein C8R44DRAFT_749248 [Mycena epipterygia]|nr:hypothetical protein C8R44DRAFT_749248 [Mycena epipterygia]